LLIPTGEIYGAFSIHPTQQCVVALLAAARVTNAAYDPNFYVGMWVTQDGYIRHELRPDGRYDEARGNRKSAYRGNYTLRGDHIDYLDDTGFIADGKFTGGVLCHAGMVLYREQKTQVKP
jgi:Agrobacterium tumefaciens protein Atu4866